MPIRTSAVDARSRAASGDIDPCATMPSIICSSMRSPGFRLDCGFCAMNPMRLPSSARMNSRDCACRSWVSKMTWPPTTRPGASTRPTSDRASADFPDPDSPTRPSTSPRRTLNDTSSTALTTPARTNKWVRKPSTCSSGAISYADGRYSCLRGVIALAPVLRDQAFEAGEKRIVTPLRIDHDLARLGFGERAPLVVPGADFDETTFLVRCFVFQRAIDMPRALRAVRLSLYHRRFEASTDLT